MLINEGRVNLDSNTESISPKNVPVKEPISGPEGSKLINLNYYSLY